MDPNALCEVDGACQLTIRGNRLFGLGLDNGGTMELVHCIYCSASLIGDFSRQELDRLLEQARSNNARLGITGILLYENRSFLQVLEGPRTVVEVLFDKIAVDKRHGRATRIIAEPIQERAFGEWTMGFPKLSLKELEEIPGLNDFFTRGHSFEQIGEGRAKTLLEAFKEGRWRAAL